jgi:hypothetical protein
VSASDLKVVAHVDDAARHLGGVDHRVVFVHVILASAIARACSDHRTAPGQGPVLAEVIEALAADLGVPPNLHVTVAEPIGMEDDMADEQHGSPVAGSLPLAGGPA